MIIFGNLIDIHNKRQFPAEISIKNGKIESINEVNNNCMEFILPGLIDAHIHIESSMLTPGNFARAAVSRGTTGVVSDPHEIANVMGIEGIKFMIKDSEKVPVKFWFGAPSCVPATKFETNGSTINSEEIRKMLKDKRIKYLAEVMNFPDVINNDPEVFEKINAAKEEGKRIDGHAPGLSGRDLKKYIMAGISTDHECSEIEEAREKIKGGMKILIREGSAAKNMNALKELFKEYPDDIMLCCDDLHPEDLMKGHIDKLVSRLISEGYNIFDVIRSATINPVMHYGLNNGLLKPGDRADFIVVDNPYEMNVLETWINGEKVFDRGKVNFGYRQKKEINNFNCTDIDEKILAVRNTFGKFRVIEAFDKELLTREIIHKPVRGEFIETSVSEDLLKIVVKDRYNDGPPSMGFIKGFGLKQGAIASSIAHDSHNIVSVGTNDKDIVGAISEIVRLRGGLAVSFNGKTESLKLNIAGIMSNRPCGEVAAEYEKINLLVKDLGCIMTAPFMTLSFMALLVIPELKISDRGLFDGKNFSMTTLFESNS